MEEVVEEDRMEEGALVTAYNLAIGGDWRRKEEEGDEEGGEGEEDLKWKVGDKCQAVYSEDGNSYSAR